MNLGSQFLACAGSEDDARQQRLPGASAFDKLGRFRPLQCLVQKMRSSALLADECCYLAADADVVTVTMSKAGTRENVAKTKS